MREIQDLTLQRHRGLDAASAEFDVRRSAFANALNAVRQHPKYLSSHGWHVTLVPIGGDIRLKRLYGDPQLLPVAGEFAGGYANSRIRLLFPGSLGTGRPILRGVQYEERGSDDHGWREIMSNGVVDFGYVSAASDAAHLSILPEWILGMALTAMLTAHRVRSVAGAPIMEYGIDIECRTIGRPLVLGSFGGRSTPVGVINPDPLRLPLMSLGDAQEIPSLLDIVWKDLLNAAGQHTEKDLSAEIPAEYLE